MKGFFRKLRKKGQGEMVDAPTRPSPTQRGPGMTGSESGRPARERLEPPQLIVGFSQSVGKQRDHNEDALFTLTTSLSSEQGNTPFGLYIVADGMGGHQHGEVASNLAIRTMASYIVDNLYIRLIHPKSNPPDLSLQEVMQGAVQEAHKAVTAQVPGGGTTLTAALILGNQITIAHVGDSRAYVIDSDQRMEALTRDHSLVKRLVELGQITKEEAAVHPQRNVLYRALGQGEPFEPDVNTTRLPAAGCLLICSDGLWGVVPEREIQEIILSAPSPQAACQRLVQAANEAGGPDNITALLVYLPN